MYIEGSIRQWRIKFIRSLREREFEFKRLAEVERKECCLKYLSVGTIVIVAIV